MTAALWRRCVAEGLGTFFLVLFGCGAVVVAADTGAFGHAGVATAFGLVVMTMIYALGEVSGAHFNPAVTLAFWVARVLPGRDVLPYMLAQCAGALLAAALLVLAWPAQDPGVTRSANALTGFITEVILSFALMMVILHVSQGAREKGLMAGIAIGAVVGLCALVGGPVSGASMNPARSIGPALAAGDLELLWVYLLAPALGTSLAVVTCRSLLGEQCCRGETGEAGCAG